MRSARLTATVGDATTSKLLSIGIVPDLSIIDGKERRRRIDTVKSLTLNKDRHMFYHMVCSNKPGSVSRFALETVRASLKKPFPVRIFVYGEEDMLALPLLSMAPDGSIVIYGQPLKGMVIVKVNGTIRQKAQDLIYDIRELS